MAYVKLNPALIKAQPGPMSHTTEFQGKLHRWTENSYPDVDFPRAFIISEGLLREKVTLFQRDGSVKGEVSRFVLCGPPPKPEVPVATVEEVEEFERAEMLAGLGEDSREVQSVRDAREQNVRDWRDLIEPKAQDEGAKQPTVSASDDEMPPAPVFAQAAAASRRGPRAPATPKSDPT